MYFLFFENKLYRLRCLLKSDFRTTFSRRSLDLSDIWVYPHQIHDYRQNNSHPEEQFVTNARGMKQVISNATPYFPSLPDLRLKKAQSIQQQKRILCIYASSFKTSKMS